MSTLPEYRKKIDEIDEKLIALFADRMEVSAQIAQCKKQEGIPVLDESRERQKLLDIADRSPQEIRDYTVELYSLIFELSRSCQNRALEVKTELTGMIEKSIQTTSQLFPDSAAVACQGVEGAYSQQACTKLFKLPNIFYFSSFDAVFSAIDKGLCRYGIVPLENSTAGSVNKVYDLMRSHKFYIVKSVRLKVDHSLLAKSGTKLADIKEIYSHEQAINQCADFLQSLGDIKVIPCENTAIAAKRVAQSDRSDIAALSSLSCMKLYGLDCVREAVQDQGNNYTRFICISKQPEIYPGADRTSLMMILPHKAGALYKVLARFYALGINLNKLESRPMPERNFEFMFYFDLDTSVYSPQFLQLMSELHTIGEEYAYLGSYSEVV